MSLPIGKPTLPQWKHHEHPKPLPTIAQPTPVKGKVIPRFRWAIVINPSPLTIQLENEDEPLPITPSTTVPVTALLPYSRVLVAQWLKRTVVIGLGKGGNDWVACDLEDGFQPRDNSDDYRPMVKLDGSGLVDFQGQMDPDGLSSPSGNWTKILQLPDGYWPRAEVRWLGFATHTPSTPYGGYISRADGGLYIRNDTGNANFPPTEHYSIIIQPWEPIPAEPY